MDRAWLAVLVAAIRAEVDEPRGAVWALGIGAITLIDLKVVPVAATGLALPAVSADFRIARWVRQSPTGRSQISCAPTGLDKCGGWFWGAISLSTVPLPRVKVPTQRFETC